MRVSYGLISVVMLALVAVGCSGDGDRSGIASLELEVNDTFPESGAPEPDPIADTEEAMLAFTQCLRELGIGIDDPTVDSDGNVQLPPIEMTFESDGSDPEAGMADFAERIEPCEQHLKGITSTFSGVDMTGIEDSFLEYAQCMRSHGVDMPDPNFSSNGGLIDLGGEDMDAFEAADSECRHLLADLGIGR